jgi:hypothetical protein
MVGFDPEPDRCIPPHPFVRCYRNLTLFYAMMCYFFLHATAYMLPPIPVTLATSSSLSTMYLFYKHTFLMISFLVINGTFYLFRKISWKKHGDGTGCYHSGACRGLTITSTSKSITVAMLVSSFLGQQLLRVAE